jgi:hypothetical protein
MESTTGMDKDDVFVLKTSRLPRGVMSGDFAYCKKISDEEIKQT